MQKYDLDGSSLSFLEVVQPQGVSYVSRGLQELSVYYSNRMSYQEVAQLVERVSGQRVLSEQTIWQLVQQSALDISETLQHRTTEALAAVAAVPELTLSVCADIDLYDAQQEEVLLFDDGIGVKAQKPQRQKQMAQGAPPEAQQRHRIISDVVVLQTAIGAFEYLSAPIAADGRISIAIEQVVQAQLQHHYAGRSSPLPLVILSDGATMIRARWSQTFGAGVVILLDWYHLSKKLRDLMAMIARSKAEKIIHLKALFANLWHGRTSVALDYLRQQVVPRHQEKWQELIGYLEKHAHEIVDYERRRQVGKAIGSGRVEKAVDQVIGQRQKRKGSSWRPQGSRALALLKVLELNGQWQQFWFPEQSA